MAQIHKRFTDDQVRGLFERYVRKEVARKYLQEMLGISKSRFFVLLNEYRKDPEKFSIQYSRSKPTRWIDPVIEANILKELAVDKKMILDKAIRSIGTTTVFSEDNSRKSTSRKYRYQRSSTEPRSMIFISPIAAAG